MKHIRQLIQSVSVLMMVVAPLDALADGEFTLKPRGRILYDFAYVDYDLAGLNDDNTASEARTARLGIQGNLGGRLKYVAEFDFQNGGDIEVRDPQAKDVKITYKINSNTSLAIGNQKTPNSLDEQTSGRFTTFLERGSVTDAFRLSRRFGALLSTKGENYTFAAGVFGNDLNAALYDHEDLLSDEWSYAARATYAPTVGEDAVLHLGASIRRFDGDNGDQIRVRARPRLHLSQRLVDVKNQGENSTVLGLEAAYINGPFHIQGEWMQEDALHNFNGYFVQVGWFLTGEKRNYSASKGSFGRLKPKHNVAEGGIGAWEIAARFDTLDLASANGGKMDTYTAGLNWYPLDQVRVMFNAIHAKARGNAKFGEGDTDGVQMRLQYDF